MFGLVGVVPAQRRALPQSLAYNPSCCCAAFRVDSSIHCGFVSCCTPNWCSHRLVTALCRQRRGWPGWEVGVGVGITAATASARSALSPACPVPSFVNDVPHRPTRACRPPASTQSLLARSARSGGGGPGGGSEFARAAGQLPGGTRKAADGSQPLQNGRRRRCLMPVAPLALPAGGVVVCGGPGVGSGGGRCWVASRPCPAAAATRARKA